MSKYGLNVKKAFHITELSTRYSTDKHTNKYKGAGLCGMYVFISLKIEEN